MGMFGESAGRRHSACPFVNLALIDCGIKIPLSTQFVTSSTQEPGKVQASARGP